MSPHAVLHLPLRGSLRTPAVLTGVLAGIVLVTGLVGVLWTDAVYPTERFVHAFLPNDLVNLALILPFLLGSVALTLQGRLVGLMCWPAALFAVTYGFTVPLVDLPVGPLSILHGAGVLVGLIALVQVLRLIDHRGLRECISTTAPVRCGGGVLIFLGLFLAMRLVGLAFLELSGQEGPEPFDLGLWLADAVATPALVFAGVAGWFRRSIGYTTTFALLAAYGVMSIGLLPLLVIQAHLAAAPVDMAGIVVVSVMVLLCALPFGLVWVPARSTA